MFYIIGITQVISKFILLISMFILIKAIFIACAKNHKINYILYTQGLSKKAKHNEMLSLTDLNTGKWIANIELFPCIMGKGKNSDIIISDNKFISRRHLIFTFESNLFFIQDLHSANGTWLNGIKLTSKRAIRNEDQIRIGQTTFKVLIKRKNEYLNSNKRKNVFNKKKKIS